MQHLENDMDELFRKAAENYPLKTEVKDCDEIVPALTNTSLSNASGKIGKRKYSLFILVVLIVLSTVVSIILFKDNQGVSPNSVSANSVQKGAEKAEKGILDNSLIKKETLPDQNEQQILLKHKKNIHSESYKPPHHLEVGHKDSISLPADLTYTVIHPIEPYKSDTIKANAIYVDSLHYKSDQTKNKPEERILKPGFYFGVVAGPQVNQVKGQGFNKAGLSIGFLAGYSFNKKLSIEGGLFYSRKHYFSDGKYFDMSKNSMPSNMKVITLKGASNTVEIPIRLKYNVSRNNKSNWFIASGFSSYILTNENNDYFALINGSQQNITVNYKHQKSYFPFAFNFSFGHELRTGTKAKLRIEPYLQIPLKGMGVGLLPVMTTGIHVGITSNRQ